MTILADGSRRRLFRSHPGGARRRGGIFAAMPAVLPLAGILVLLAQHPVAQEQRDPHSATSHHPFTGIQEWVRIFDDPARDAWQKPEEVTSSLRLTPGMVVADLGAGTGYFTAYLSRAVGPKGLVLAIDTEAEMVRHLGWRSRKEGLTNVLPILAAPEDPFLPRGRVDRVLIVDTYHHIDHRLEYFRKMREALAPRGRVAIVDFHKKPLPVGPPLEHKLDRGFVVDEMRQGGWSLAEEKTVLPYQYFLLFEPAAR